MIGLYRHTSYKRQFNYIAIGLINGGSLINDSTPINDGIA